MTRDKRNQRVEAGEAYVAIAKYLDSRPPLKMVEGGPEEQERERDKHSWNSIIVCHILYAIVFEISIKIVWELDNGQACRHTHDINALFDELADDSQSKIRSIFDVQVASVSEIEGTLSGVTRKLGDVVPFSSWKEALQANEDIVKNFKYDNKFKGKSTLVGSSIWNGRTLWDLPPGYESFVVKLFNYAKSRVGVGNMYD